MLLAELCPLDVRQLHICHKQREYMVDKAGARDALFGDAPMRQEETLAGPWGEYKR